MSPAPNTAYEKVAQTRPRIRRDVLFTKTPDGVLFHNANSGFRITSAAGYRLATILVPHLNGTNRIADICARLPEGQRVMIGELVGALYDRGFARDVPVPDPESPSALEPEVAERFAAQIAYVDHYADEAPQRFAAFRNTTVAVLGSGPLAEACAAGLIRNGSAAIWTTPGTSTAAARAEAGDSTRVAELPRAEELTWADLDGIDVVLVAGGDTAVRQTYQLLHPGVPAGVALLPAWRYGDRAIIGPLMGAERSGCWCCAMLRLEANHDSRTAAQVWSATVLPKAPATPARPIGRPLAGMLGNLLAYEVFRLTTGALPAETAGKVIVQNIESLDVIAEPLLVHPRCPFCSPAGAELPLTNLSLDSLVDTDERADAIVDELNARLPLLQPHVGVFTGFRDEHVTQTPIKVGAVAFSDFTGTRRTISAFDLHHVAGARRRALHEAAVSYTSQLAVTAEKDGWVPATSLLTGESAAVPAAAVEPFGAANRDRTVEPTRCGGGAGSSVDEAVRNGLGSALAFAALQRAMAGASVRAIQLDTVDGDNELIFLVKSAANLGVAVELLDLNGEAEQPLSVLVARCADPDGQSALWSIAADPSWRGAAVRALCDLLGRVQLRLRPAETDRPAGANTPDLTGRPDGSGHPDERDPILIDFDPATLVSTLEGPARIDSARTWADVLANLKATGTDAYVARVSGADLQSAGIVAVRVLLAAQEPR